MSPPSSPPVLNPQNVVTTRENYWGPILISIFCEIFILGGIFSQSTRYLARCSRDSIRVKLMIAVLILSVLVKTVLDVEDVYRDYIFRISSAPPATLRPFLLARPFLGEIPLLVSQLFLSHRVWVASQWKVLPALVGVIGSLASCSLLLVFGVTRAMYPQPMVDRKKVGIWIPPWAFTTAAVDVYLSITLCYFLLQTRKNAHSYRLDFILSRLASLVVTTCFPPAIMSCLMAILEIAGKRIAAWQFFNIILASVYTVCILYTRESFCSPSLDLRAATLEKLTLIATVNSRNEIVAEAISHSLEHDPTGAGLAATSGSRSDPTQPSKKGRAQPMTALFNRMRDSRHARTTGTISESARRNNANDVGLELELTEMEKPPVISS
ncbi:BQ2448_45 [Microbotryum intermedium]|uniref:BQ2448_45 protein n=1 Tax=Microbotryum intermedium TaxID=269621 RepID=A0A238F7T0_9BASI|nr:BQ2448_45 [Microbotryum intermedium]